MYKVVIRKKALKELEEFPRKDYQRATTAILDLEKDPRPHGSRKLQDRAGYRIRIGDFRVIYVINDSNKEVTIIKEGNRNDIYE